MATRLRGGFGFSAAAASFGEGLGPLPLAGAPCSVVGKTETITRFPDGNRIVETGRVQYYRDGQGRLRTERPLGPTQIQMVTINDVVLGESYVLMPDKSYNVMKTNTAVQARGPASPSNPTILLSLGNAGMGFGPADKVATAVELGAKEIDGVNAVGKRWEYSVPADTVGNEKPITITVEQWFSPDLGIVVLASQQTSIGTEITYQIELSRSEPDADLFRVPADYTHRDPGAAGAFQLRAVQKPEAPGSAAPSR